MRIGIDIDDTITNTTEQIDLYAKEYTENILKRKFSINRIEIYDPMWSKMVYGWSIEEEKAFWDMMYYEKVVENVKPKDDAVEIINKLYENNEIIIITARWDRESKIIRKMTKDWLEKYNIRYHKLYIGHKDKRKIVEENKINLFIDDSIKTCNEINDMGIKTFLMNARVNENIDSGELTRVYSWAEIYSKIEGGF